MIIALAGRCGSGKSELSKICVDNGYERLYFALPLKIMVSKLLNCTIEEADKRKNDEFELFLTEDKLKFISEETKIPLKIVIQKLGEHPFHNTREMYQYIGTDLIREYNADWHVNKLKEMIKPNTDYIVDDLRFPNEKMFLDTLGAISFYVVRPNLENISNHISETSLRWYNFDNVIVNDRNLEYLKYNWETFLNNGFANSLISRAQLLYKIQVDTQLRDEFLKNNEPFNMFDSLFISKHMFTYSGKFMEYNENIQKIENFNNSIFRVYYKNGDIEIVTNPLMIEDLKLFYENEK